MPGQGQVGPNLQKDLPLFSFFLFLFFFPLCRCPSYTYTPLPHPLFSAFGQKLPLWLPAGRSVLARNAHILLGPYSKHTSSLVGRKAGGLGGALFDPVIPQMFAESLLCLGRYQAGHWSAQAVEAGVCRGRRDRYHIGRGRWEQGVCFRREVRGARGGKGYLPEKASLVYHT